MYKLFMLWEEVQLTDKTALHTSLALCKYVHNICEDENGQRSVTASLSFQSITPRS